MTNQEYIPEVDYLAVALTRSPMFMGLNVRVFFSNLAICSLICIDAHTVMGIPLFIFLHLFMLKWSIKEPNFLYLYLMSLFKTPPSLNSWFWGKTNSYEPW